MDISLAISLVVMFVGLFIYWFSVGKLLEIGRIMFFSGLLAALLKFSGHAALHIGS